MTAKVLLYVQHLLGIGHLKRAALLAEALSDAGAEVVFVSGGPPDEGLELGGARLLQLPPCHARDERFELLDETGKPVDETWKERRRALLLDIFRAEKPDALAIELFPFGRRQMRFELLPLLQEARNSAKRPLVFCSVRDILSKRPSPDKEAWILEILARFFDSVLVHGDPSFIPFDATFPAASELAGKLRYTGYVTAAKAIEAPPPSGEVLVSTGGGAVAGPLLEAALAARPLTSLSQTPWRLLAGGNFPERDFLALKRRAPDGVTLERARPDFRMLLAACRLSVSQAGYNTTLEVLSAGVPAVLVPYAAGEEGEQSLRARLLADRDLLTVVEERGLTRQSLAAGIERELRRKRPESPPRLDLGGAAQSAKLVLQALLQREREA